MLFREAGEYYTTFVDQYPTLMPTPTFATSTRPMGTDETEAAFGFFYELKNHAALGEFEHFAEEIRYPITVKVDGKAKTLFYAAEVEANFEKILSEDVIQKFISTDDSKLILHKMV